MDKNFIVFVHYKYYTITIIYFYYFFNSTQNQHLERRISDYYLQSEKNFRKLETDLSRVENSIGRLMDNHHNNAFRA